MVRADVETIPGPNPRPGVPAPASTCPDGRYIEIPVVVRVFNPYGFGAVNSGAH